MCYGKTLERTYNYGKWQNIKTPGSHAIKVCDVLGIDSTTHIHLCYSLEYAINTYSHAFAVPMLEYVRVIVEGCYGAQVVA